MRNKAGATLSGLLVAVVIGSPVIGRGQEPLCQFTTTALTGAPALVGPPDVTSRLHVIAQPESPVELVAVDFTGTQLVIEEGAIARSYSFQQRAVVEVRNRSDQTIDRIDVGVMAGVCQSAGPRPRQSWTGTLQPGETTPIQLGGGGGGGSGTVSPSMGPLLVWAWVERVDFGTCAYRPAQVVPKALCDDGRPIRPTLPR
jgi:hypothetical protein